MLTFTRIRLLKLYGAMLFRRQARALGFRLLHNDVSKFIIAMCKKTIEERKANNIERKDFMQLMINLYRDEDDVSGDGEGLSLKEIAAQAFLFFFAGVYICWTCCPFMNCICNQTTNQVPIIFLYFYVCGITISWLSKDSKHRRQVPLLSIYSQCLYS